VSGSIDVDLNNISDIINNSLGTADGVTSGVEAQSENIGTAVGVNLMIVVFTIAIIAALAIIFMLIAKAKGLGKAVKK
jgi:hypothetical protein